MTNLYCLALAAFAFSLALSSAQAETQFECVNTTDASDLIYFSHDTENGFNFEELGWLQPWFSGPYITLFNSNAHKAGDANSLERGATFIYHIQKDSILNLIDRGISNDNNVVSNWIKMSGLKSYYISYFYALDFKTQSLERTKIEAGDRIISSQESYTCKTNSGYFK